jgi:hypothetical protein
MQKYILCVLLSYCQQHKNISVVQQIFYSILFNWHAQNATTPCSSQELLPFLHFIYASLPPFSTNYSSILPHFILPSIYWSSLVGVVSKFIYNTLGNSILRPFSVRVGPGSSVSIATGYGLDGPGIKSTWRRDFTHLSRPGAHPASCTMCTRPFSG